MQFVSVRCAEKPRTIEFYQEKLNRLLEYAALANATLDNIDEALIEEYVQERRKLVAPATVNRQLASLIVCRKSASFRENAHGNLCSAASRSRST